MKKYIFFILLISFKTLNAQTIISFYNNTSKKIFASYVALDKQCICWVSNGWYEIEPYAKKNLDIGNYKGFVYLHGEQETFWKSNSWGNGYFFCVDPSNAFAIRYADKANCKKNAEYSELKVSNGINDWTFNQ